MVALSHSYRPCAAANPRAPVFGGQNLRKSLSASTTSSVLQCPQEPSELEGPKQTRHMALWSKSQERTKTMHTCSRTWHETILLQTFTYYVECHFGVHLIIVIS